MKTIRELIEAQTTITAACRAAGRGLTEDETRQFDDLQRQIDELRAQQPPAAAPAGAADGNPPPAADPNADAQRAVSNERKRISDLLSLSRDTGLPVEEHIRSGASMETVRAAAITYMVQHGAPVAAHVTHDEGDKFRSAAADAILMRSGVTVEKPADGARDLRGMSIRDLAIESMSREGRSAAELLRMDKSDLYAELSRQFFNPTAAFPAILDNAIRKNIEVRYQQIPVTFDRWTSKGSVNDFKPTKDHSYLMGSAGEFLRVGETGELKHDKISTDLQPQRQIDTFGRQFSMSRQAFINDDIGFITEVPGAYAMSAKRTINKQVYSILVNNAAIYDGVALFDAAHNNLITSGAAPSNETIQKLMMKLLHQKDPFGESIMIQPAHIIVPVGYGFTVSTIFDSPTINTSGNTQATNPLYKYRSQIEIVEEVAINGLTASGAAVPWFMAGNKDYAKNIQVDYLNGQETPTIRRSEVPGQLGFVWDIWLDWGVTVVDFRGIAKNPGAAISD